MHISFPHVGVVTKAYTFDILKYLIKQLGLW